MQDENSSEVLKLLRNLTEQVENLTRRLDKLDGNTVEPTPLRVKQGNSANIVEGLSVLDTAAIGAGDSLAYATGYVTGKLGADQDPVAAEVADYVEGFKLGTAVRDRVAPRPSWDREVKRN